MTDFHLFPYHLVEKECRVILYGAGAVMRCYVNQLQTAPHCEILCAADRNHADIDSYKDIEVVSPKAILEMQYDYVVIAVASQFRKSVHADLVELGIAHEKIVCADYHRMAFSENHTAEAVVVKGIFDILGIDKPTYIDCGACHPFAHNNTALFYQNGSRGICIEANPDLIGEFFAERPDDINLNLGIAAKQGIGTFYLLGNEWLNTFSIDAAEYAVGFYSELGLSTENTIQIQLETLNAIVDKYNGGIFPEFLDIDIEGLDYDVLEKCDFTKSSPLVICVEVGTLEVARFNKVMAEKQCEGGGFLPYCRIPYNTIYVRKDIYNQVLGLEEAEE